MRFTKHLGDPIGVTLIEALVKNEHVLYIWKSLPHSLAKLQEATGKKSLFTKRKCLFN